jgi:hypothetical protein
LKVVVHAQATPDVGDASPVDVLAHGLWKARVDEVVMPTPIGLNAIRTLETWRRADLVLLAASSLGLSSPLEKWPARR